VSVVVVKLVSVWSPAEFAPKVRVLDPDIAERHLQGLAIEMRCKSAVRVRANVGDDIDRVVAD
jgi:hypothetical protein